MEVYALVKNGVVERVNISLPTVIDNTSIPVGATGLSEFGLYPQVTVIPEYDAATQRLGGVEYRFDGDKVNLVYAVEDIPESELNPVPQSVTMRQARLALLDLDLLSSIDEAINAMPEPDKTKAKIEWEYAAVVERNSDWVSDLGQQLGLSDVQVDDLFRLATTK